MAEFDYGKKRTLQEAIDTVDSYVEPRECFVWHINNRWGYQSFSISGDTPCAHYVSHQIGLKGSGAVCKDGYLVRVDDVVSRLGDPIEPGEARPGDVWARLKHAHRKGSGKEPTSHCGMVLKVEAVEGGSPRITIRHCSSGQKKVAEDDWKAKFGEGGKFYRLKGAQQTIEGSANFHRLMKGFAYRKPFSSGGRA